MRLNSFTNHSGAMLVVLLAVALPAMAQNAQVTIGKQASRIPKVCQLVVPAAIEGNVDVAALVKEAYCKGAGDMLTEYSYTMITSGRAIDKKGHTREDSTTYEVFIPTMKSGTTGKGVLVITAHNGVPVPLKELEKARAKAGERLEKAEEQNTRETSEAPDGDPNVKGMLPLGMYTHTTNSRSSLGSKGSASLAIHTFLRTCNLTLVRREQHDGRETLVFSFVPRADAVFKNDEKYVAQLTGEIWIDAQDHIVTRLAGWPGVNTLANQPQPSGERPPAVYAEMMHLPEGVWLPHVIRINGADYQTLFDGITTDTISTFSKYIRFSTEIKDVKVGQPDNF
jgi:hypothetical protein